jgi:hypothetical protein
MTMPIFLELLAEDKSVISYRKRFAMALDSAMAALLLQQMIHLWKLKGRRPFYKFRLPCQHALYEPDDSWVEEMEWSKNEFDSALKVIGTKIVRGVSKSDMLATEFPERKTGEADSSYYDRLQVAFSRLVIYWTDSNRLTWYQVNEDLLGKFINRIYLDKSVTLRYLKSQLPGTIQKNQESGNTSNPETLSETSTETKDSARCSRADVEASFLMPMPKGYSRTLRLTVLLPSLLALLQRELTEVEMQAAEAERKAVQDEAIVANIKAWLEATKNLDPNAYKNKTYRSYAKALHEAGCTAEDIKAFVNDRMQEEFWRKAGVSLQVIVKDIQRWRESKVDHAPPLAGDLEDDFAENPEDPYVAMPSAVRDLYAALGIPQ